MTRPPVKSKSSMYTRLRAGEFGNTTNSYLSIDDWLASDEHAKYSRWGVRTMTPGGPCRLNCPVEQVREVAESFQRAGHKVNISLMVDAVAAVTMWGELYDSPTGLVLEGIEFPKTDEGWDWRGSMPNPALRKSWTGILARHTLRRHLNDNSYDDIMELVELYPGHILEFSSLSACLGTHPGRNVIMWEVRLY